MLYFGLLALAVGFGLPIAAAGAAIGQGLATKSALEGISRQPEAAPRIQLTLILGLALIESLVIYVLLTFFILQARLPNSEKMMEVVKEMAGAKTPAKVSINASPLTLSANGELTSKLTISVWDRDGVPLKGQKLSITAGEGKIEGLTDNGDGTYTAFLTIPYKRKGEITVKVSAENGVYDDLILPIMPMQVSKDMGR